MHPHEIELLILNQVTQEKDQDKTKLKVENFSFSHLGGDDNWIKAWELGIEIILSLFF